MNIPSGATRGIGLAITHALASRGCSILGTYLTSTASATSLTTLITSLPNTSTFHAIPADIASPHSPQQILTALQTHFPNRKVDIIINNASLTPLVALGDLTCDILTNTFQANITFPTLLVQILLPYISRSGSARIINISSEGSKLARPRASAYSASKAALESLTRTWAKELGQEYNGLTCNAVLPGMVETDLWERLPAERKAFWEPVIRETAVEGRLGRAEEVAGMVVWLAGDEAVWVSGACLAVNGGGNVFA